MYMSSCISTAHSSRIFVKVEFSQRILEKCSNIEFHENPSSGSRVIPCGQTDRQTDGQTGGQTDRQTDKHDETNSIFFFAILRKRLKIIPKSGYITTGWEKVVACLEILSRYSLSKTKKFEAGYSVEQSEFGPVSFPSLFLGTFHLCCCFDLVLVAACLTKPLRVERNK